jgi:phospholipid/cholesterol/gamma-HCH transport system substrate-binding protein
VEEITRKVSSGEGTLGKLLTDDTTVNNLNKAVESFSELGNRVDRLRTYITFRNEFQLDNSDSKGYFRLRLQPRERRGYIVEVSDDPRGKVTETTLDVTSGGTTTTTTTLKTERRLTLSALFAQRFGRDFEVKGGLMENSAGIGVGYEPERHVTLLFDAWDFNSVRAQHDSPHLKATARVHLGDYVFLQGGMDDFLNSHYSTPFVGAGLTFEDEDLKYLLGTAASALH